MLKRRRDGATKRGDGQPGHTSTCQSERKKIARQSFLYFLYLFAKMHKEPFIYY